MKSKHLVFLLSERVFGVRLVGAIEILPWRPTRPVALSYSYVEGLLDFRGTIYPVHNLSQRLGLKKAEPTGLTSEQKEQGAKGKSILLLEESQTPFGIVVDSVIRMTNLEDPAAGRELPDIDSKYIKGFAYDEDQEIVILDFERLLHAN